MSGPRLHVVGSEAPPGRWKLRHWVGGAMFIAAPALGVWTVVDPTLGGQRDGIMSTLLLVLVVALVIHHRRRNPLPPAREPDQVVLHIHRRAWW